jgi:hypothetical protein
MGLPGIEPACERQEIQTKFWPKYLKGRDHLNDPREDVRIISEWILDKYGGEIWTRFIWLRTGTSSAVL